MPIVFTGNFTRMVAVFERADSSELGSFASFWTSADDSDLTPETDIVRGDRHVSKVPFPDSCIAAKQTLFDHFVRAGRAPMPQIEAERLGGFQIDHQLVCTADQPASLRPLSAQSWAMQERPQRQRPLRPKLGRSCRASSPAPRPQSNRTTMPGAA